MSADTYAWDDLSPEACRYWQTMRSVQGGSRPDATPDERLREALQAAAEPGSRLACHLWTCDHCGYYGIVHDIGMDMGPGRLGSVVGYHCAACCDRGPCDDRQRAYAYVAPLRADGAFLRVPMSVPKVHPPDTLISTPIERCLACRGGVRCDKDHGCRWCGHTAAAHGQHQPTTRVPPPHPSTVVRSRACVGDAGACGCLHYDTQKL